MRIWVERGFRQKSTGYELQKMFSPHAFLGYPGRAAEQRNQYENDMQLLSHFYKKYPEVRYFPQATKLNFGFGGLVEITHPAAVFVKKQRALMAKGYSQQKAFEMVETELSKALNQQKEELRILRGLAITQYGSQSYLDRFSEVAELESSLKVKRLERDIPKYQRSQADWVRELQGEETPTDEQNTSFQRESIEDLLQVESKKAFSVSD